MSNPNPDPIQQAIETQTQPVPLEIPIPGTPQVFKGNTPQEVLDQLVKAQAEATRTIAEARQQAQQYQAELERLKNPPPPEKQDDAATQEYFRMWAEKPKEALKHQLRELGLPIDKLQASMVNNIVQAEVQEFMNRCPDYPDTPEARQLMTQTLKQKHGDTIEAASADNMELAFRHLVRNNLITPNHVPAQGLVNQPSPLPNIRGGGVPQNPVTDTLANFRNLSTEQMAKVLEQLHAQGVQ